MELGHRDRGRRGQPAHARARPSRCLRAAAIWRGPDAAELRRVEEAAVPLGPGRDADPAFALEEPLGAGRGGEADAWSADPLPARIRPVVRGSIDGLLHPPPARDRVRDCLPPPAAHPHHDRRHPRPPGRVPGHGPAARGVGDEAEDQMHVARRHRRPAGVVCAQLGRHAGLRPRPPPFPHRLPAHAQVQGG